MDVEIRFSWMSKWVFRIYKYLTCMGLYKFETSSIKNGKREKEGKQTTINEPNCKLHLRTNFESKMISFCKHFFLFPVFDSNGNDGEEEEAKKKQNTFNETCVIFLKSCGLTHIDKLLQSNLHFPTVIEIGSSIISIVV